MFDNCHRSHLSEYQSVPRHMWAVLSSVVGTKSVMHMDSRAAYLLSLMFVLGCARKLPPANPGQTTLVSRPKSTVISPNPIPVQDVHVLSRPDVDLARIVPSVT